MLNSKIFREEISPDNSNGRLTPPGELVMAVTSYQAQLRIESWFLKLWGKAGFQLWLAVLVATREPVSTVRVESILTLNLPMNYEETEPSIDNWHFSHLSLFSQLAVMLLLQARLDRVSFPLSCPVLVSLNHLHVGYHSDTKDILSPLEPPPSEICWKYKLCSIPGLPRRLEKLSKAPQSMDSTYSTNMWALLPDPKHLTNSMRVAWRKASSPRCLSLIS